MTKEFFERGKQIAEWADNNMTKQTAQDHNLTYEDGFAHGYEAHRAEQALEQPAQEPVAWASTGYFELLKKTHCAMLPISDEKRSIYTIPLYTKDAQYE